jgi:hypothetical protein
MAGSDRGLWGEGVLGGASAEPLDPGLGRRGVVGRGPSGGAAILGRVWRGARWEGYL